MYLKNVLSSTWIINKKSFNVQILQRLRPTEFYFRYNEVSDLYLQKGYQNSIRHSIISLSSLLKELLRKVDKAVTFEKRGEEEEAIGIPGLSYSRDWDRFEKKRDGIKGQNLAILASRGIPQLPYCWHDKEQESTKFLRAQHTSEVSVLLEPYWILDSGSRRTTLNEVYPLPA